MKNLIKRAALLLVCAVFFCACTACSSQSKQAENPPKYTLYCGLNDADANQQILSLEEAQEAARAIILDNGCGYTEYVAFGGYQSGDTVINNETLVYEICFADAAVVETIAAEIQTQLNLTPILVVEGTTSYQFTA